MSENTWNDPRITAYVLDELSGEDRDAFELELESSDQLAAAVEEARCVTDQLATLYLAEEMPPLDEDRREAILGFDPANVTPASATQKRSLRFPMTLLAAAATLILMIGLAPLLNQRKPETTISQSGDSGRQRGELIVDKDALIVDKEDEWQDEELTDRKLTDGELAVMTAGRQADGMSNLAAVELMESVEVKKEGEARVEDSFNVDVFAGKGVGGGALGGGVKMPAAEIAAGTGSAAERGGEVARREIRSLKEINFENEEGERVAGVNELRSGTTVAGAALGRGLGTTRLSEELLDVGEKVRAVQTESPNFAQPASGVERSSRGREPAVQRSRVGGMAPQGQAATPAPMFDPQPVAPPATASPVVEGISDDSEAFFYTPVETESFSRSGKRGRQAVQDMREPLVETESRMRAIRDSDSQQRSGFGRGANVEKSSESVRGSTVVPVRGNVARRKLGDRGFGFRDSAVSKLEQERLDFDSSDESEPMAEGQGPGNAGDRFDPITDNPFRRVSEHPLSTFSVDVDTASYSKVRDFLMRADQLPSPDAVRIEEMVNYFEYDYQTPKADADHPFAAEATITSCPWNEEHRLARISLKGKTMKKKQRPPCNLVFLLDTSGSMDKPNKLPLVVKGMKMLLGELREQDRVAITVYAGSAGLILDSTSARKKTKISQALAELSADGSTDGGSGIALAYQTARDHFIPEGVNRVILCTDGDFNVGVTGDGGLVRLVEKESKGGIYLSVLGFGMGNHNDAMLEQISGRGNGNYAYIDTEAEARKVLVDQTSSTLVTIAKNVKMQVDFNAAEVSAYRLIGYENRILAKEDFNDDKKDAGEIGAGHSVTAFYELVPAGIEAELAAPQVDRLKYQSEPKPTEAANSGETLTLKLRYLLPDAVVERGDESTLVEFPVKDEGVEFEDADTEFRFAAAVAGFGMKLRRSKYAGTWTLSDVIRVAESSGGKDKYELRAEFVDLVRKASELMGQQ